MYEIIPKNTVGKDTNVVPWILNKYADLSIYKVHYENKYKGQIQ